MNTFTIEDVQYINNIRFFLSTTNPEDGLKWLERSLGVAQRTMPPGVKQIIRSVGKTAIGAGKQGAKTIHDYHKRLENELTKANAPGSPASQDPVPPGMERQPVIIVTDNGRTFTQGPDKIVPKGSALPPWRPYYVDSRGNRIFPPKNGWAKDGMTGEGKLPKTSEPTPQSKISDKINTTFRRSRTATQSSPLVFDLDGDGIEIAQLTTAGDGVQPTLFDHDGDGIKTGTAWLKSDDGILVLDRNGNGAIDSGRELFGNHTLLASGQQAADGYAALAELDANADGAIDAQDARWNQLRLWRDHNQDGIGQAEELSALDTLGLTRIGLNKTDKTQNLGDGTKLDGQAEYTRNGQTYAYTDAWFAENAFYREFISGNFLINRELI